MQVKYDLTKAVTGDDDKETIHCEFDVSNSDINWLSGEICIRRSILFIVISQTYFLTRLELTQLMLTCCSHMNSASV